MAVPALPEQKAAMLRAAPFTYEHVGATASEPPRTMGYAWMQRSAPLVRRDFDAACADLFTWRLHEQAGLRIQASATPLQADTVVLMRLGFGLVSIHIPCRVVYLIEEPRLRGFAYGTLPGHPEAGEERFTLEQHTDGSISIAITAFSKPASHLAKLGGPFTRRVQQLMTNRYLRALDRP